MSLPLRRFWPRLAQDRGGVTQYRVEIEVAPGVMQHGYLLLPEAGLRGPRPAVLVPFYAPEVSVDYEGPRPITGQAARFFKGGERPVQRDFALQLVLHLLRLFHHRLHVAG